MKNLMLIALFFLGALQTTQAQTADTDTEVTIEDYERMLRAEENMEFRNYAINTLALTSEEIMDFDPVYREYMRKKNEIKQRQYGMLEDYRDEMAEDDRKQDELNETADFIENYWETEIAQLELEKDIFDRMEDKIGVDNAFGFFLLEDMMNSEPQKAIVEKQYVPVFIEMGEMSSSEKNMKKDAKAKTVKNNTADRRYRKDIDKFSKWVESGKGKVSLDHDYTRNGIYALSAAITSLADAAKVPENLAYEAMTLKAKADKLLIDKSSDKHADWTREAFIMAADMLETIQKQGGFSNDVQSVAHVAAAAKKIDPNQLMTNQAAQVNNFFAKAQAAIDSMANDVSWAMR